MKANNMILFLIFIFTMPAYAGEQDELEALLGLLEEETELATKTKMNADFVPGMITVLHGEDLEALGIRNAWEALSLVSGIDTTRFSFGEMITQIRGAGQTMLAGNLKILIDSEAVNNNIDGYAFAALSLPSAQIERIEVVRGPGGAIHGEFAYAGVVNIIPRKKQQRVYLGTADHGTREFGAIYSGHSGDLHIHANMGGMNSDGSRLISGPDGFAAEHVGYSPGPIDDRENTRFALFGAEYADYTLRANFMRREMGGYFGGRALPPPQGTEKSRNQTSGVALQKIWNPTKNLQTVTRLAWRRGEVHDAKALSYPAGARLLSGFPPIPSQNPEDIAPFDSYATNGATDNRHEAETRLTWKGFNKQTWLLGVSYAGLKLDKTWSRSNFDKESEQFFLEPIYRENKEAELPAGEKREVFSLTAQNQIALSDNLELTAGLHYDHYSDVGDSVSPRIAGVWRFHPGHIFKLQYAEAFRPPTLTELYLGGFEHKLKPETLDSYEFGYIYRQPSQVIRVTLFHTRLNNLISRRPGPITESSFRNLGEIRLRGMECEWERKITANWRVAANLSYVDTENRSTGSALTGSADWLANLGLFGRLSANTLMTARWRYVSELTGYGLRLSPREPFIVFPGPASAHTLDLNLTHTPPGITGLTLRTGIDNLFDADISYPTPPNTYADNLTQPGRAWWVRVSYDLQ